MSRPRKRHADSSNDGRHFGVTLGENDSFGVCLVYIQLMGGRVTFYIDGAKYDGGHSSHHGMGSSRGIPNAVVKCRLRRVLVKYMDWIFLTNMH